MRHRSGRRRLSQNHAALKQVDALLSGRPRELEVPISGLPGRVGELFSLYEGLFELRDYRVASVDRRLDDLWVARLERATKLGQVMDGRVRLVGPTLSRRKR